MAKDKVAGIFKAGCDQILYFRSVKALVLVLDFALDRILAVSFHTQRVFHYA